MPRDVQFRAMQGCMLSPTKTRLEYASAWRTEGRQENREGEASLDKAPKTSTLRARTVRFPK